MQAAQGCALPCPLSSGVLRACSKTLRCVDSSSGPPLRPMLSPLSSSACTRPLTLDHYTSGLHDVTISCQIASAIEVPSSFCLLALQSEYLLVPRCRIQAPLLVSYINSLVAASEQMRRPWLPAMPCPKKRALAQLRRTVSASVPEG